MRVNERKPIQNTHIDLGVSDENKKKTQWFGLGFITRHIITQDSNIGIVDTYALAVNVGQFSVTESVHENFCLRSSTCLLSIRFFLHLFFFIYWERTTGNQMKKHETARFSRWLVRTFRVAHTHTVPKWIKLNATKADAVYKALAHTRKKIKCEFFFPRTVDCWS